MIGQSHIEEVTESSKHPFFFNHNAFHPFSIKLVIWNNSSLLGSYLLNPAWEREEAQEAQKTEEAQEDR